MNVNLEPGVLIVEPVEDGPVTSVGRVVAGGPKRLMDRIVVYEPRPTATLEGGTRVMIRRSWILAVEGEPKPSDGPSDG